jgi:hypothetical protein
MGSLIEMSDLPGSAATGTVKNVSSFGAYIDVGGSRDGLLHFSSDELKGIDKGRLYKFFSDRIGWPFKVRILPSRVDSNAISLIPDEPIVL